MIRRLTVLTAAALLLAGCASKFESKTLAERYDVRSVSIGVMPINHLDKPSVEVISDPLKYIPRVGTLLVAKGNDTKRRKFDEALDALAYDYRTRFDQVFIEALTQSGLDARALNIPRKPHRQAGRVLERKFEKQYPRQLPEPVDLILDAYVDFVGYAADGLTADYRPTFFLAVRLVDARSHEVVYQSRALYNAPEDPEGGALTLVADVNYVFEDFNAIMADVPRARDGLDQAIVAVADHIAQALR